MTPNQRVISTGRTLRQVLEALEAHQMPPRDKVFTEKDEEITLDKVRNGQANSCIYEERNVCHASLFSSSASSGKTRLKIKADFFLT